MIKNLITTGCSFSEGTKWPKKVVDAVYETYGCKLNWYNLGKASAGNFYIADSLITYLSKQPLDPTETLVLVMWSGVSRKDIIVSAEFGQLLQTNQNHIQQNNFHYALSGGQVGSWQSEVLFPRTNTYRWFLRPIFENLYKCADNASMAHETLSHMLRTKDFLELRNFNYKFMSYVNYWKNTDGWVSENLDFNIPYVVPDHPFLNQLGDHWIWTDENKNCLYEHACATTSLESDGFHPTNQANKDFAWRFIMPNIKGYFE